MGFFASSLSTLKYILRLLGDKTCTFEASVISFIFHVQNETTAALHEEQRGAENGRFYRQVNYEELCGKSTLTLLKSKANVTCVVN